MEICFNGNDCRLIDDDRKSMIGLMASRNAHERSLDPSILIQRLFEHMEKPSMKSSKAVIVRRSGLAS
jgi:hypothetical protein